MFKINKLTKKYSSSDTSYRGIKNISTELKDNEIVCILGKSGSGKSTLLRSMAGLETIDSGTVSTDSKIRYSYVSQDYTLWPHLTVLENMVLAPSLRLDIKEDLIVEAKSLLKRFELESYENSYPRDLSGGQRQRVALLRAVMNKPDILFLDEITSALDPELTKGVLDLIRALSKDGYAMFIVTHHISFALSIADKILFLKDGELIADESSAQFFMNQSNQEIKSFILDIAKSDENIEIFKGREQFQAYHLGLMKRLPEDSTIYVAGAVGDQWYGPMDEFYPAYEKLRIEKKITWKMVTYSEGEVEKRLAKEYPELNHFRKMPRSIQNPANYNVFGDTVITQIFDDEPTIIQIKNRSIAEAYLRFFEELWELSK